MPQPSHLPDDGYLRKIGLVVYLVSSLEGLLLLDLPRLETAIPAELSVKGLAGKTTLKVGLELVKYAPQCSSREVEVYLEAGGNALLEVAPQRNALLHARPATDEHGPLRLFQRRMLEAHLVNDTWLERLIQRIEDLQVELNALRPSFIT